MPQVAIFDLSVGPERAPLRLSGWKNGADEVVAGPAAYLFECRKSTQDPWLAQKLLAISFDKPMELVLLQADHQYRIVFESSAFMESHKGEHCRVGLHLADAAILRSEDFTP